jgi:periplasmic copper chaperone A
MVSADALDVKPQGTTRLAPGGDHIMLEDLPAPLRPGDQVVLTLTFERFGAVSTTATVESYSAIAAGVGSDPAGAPAGG